MDPYMGNYIFKIKYGDILRRITVVRRYGPEPDMSFSQLEDTIRQIFKIPATSELGIVYKDNEDEVVTIGDYSDIKDACVFQKLNPLRLTVVAQDSQRSPHEDCACESLSVDPPSWAADISLKLDQLLVAVKKQLVEPGVEAASTIANHLVLDGVGFSPIDDPAVEPAKDVLPEEWRFDMAESGYQSEFLRRAMILQQRVLNESDDTRGVSSTEAYSKQEARV